MRDTNRDRKRDHVRGSEVFFAPCPRGLEQVLSEELGRLGARDIEPTQGGVGFGGPFQLCYRVNLMSRIASRVLWRVGRSPYRHEQDVLRIARQLPWPRWFGSRRSIKVKVSAQDCPLRSLEFVTLRIKDGICDRFREEGKSRPDVDTSRPDIRVHAFLDDRFVTMYVDTSGEALFKRGLRSGSVPAPLRENLAAGLLALSGWTREQALFDPMCGSGTILMEAAEIAIGRPPGVGRSFAFEKLHNFNAAIWRELSSESRQSARAPVHPKIHGSDSSAAALEQARRNADQAGLAEEITLDQADVLDVNPPSETGVILMNPPYGRRTDTAAGLASLYPRLGDVLKQRFPNWRAYIFTADLRLPKLIGLRCSRKIPLFNGALDCRLYEFKLVRGKLRATVSGGSSDTSGSAQT